MEYNEKDAIAYILSKLPPERAQAYTDDEILNVIDIIWDFYEESGLLDPATAFEDEDDDAEARELEALTKHVRRMLAKDKGSNIDPQDIEAIINAEIEYENSII